MGLPFTPDQFFDLFVPYNGAWWPALGALWVASAVVAVLLPTRYRPGDRWIAGLLALHWAWSGVAYHAVYFTRINPAAWLFAALFAAEAVLLLRDGVIKATLSFGPGGRAWALAAWALVAYALLYPAINAAQHHTWSRIPAFGVPCPTTIFTAGLLMLSQRGSWRLSAIPVIWSAIGGSAAPLLGVRADYALPVAGLVLAIFTVRSGIPRAPTGTTSAMGSSGTPAASSQAHSNRHPAAIDSPGGGQTRCDLNRPPAGAP